MTGRPSSLGVLIFMIEFRQTMDQHSLDVVRGERVIAMVQWHPERPPRIISWSYPAEFTLDEVGLMHAKLKACAGK